MQIPWANLKEHCKWAKKVMIKFGGNLGYRLRPETISPQFADLSSTTHVKIVFRGGLLYPKPLSLYCLPRRTQGGVGLTSLL